MSLELLAGSIITDEDLKRYRYVVHCLLGYTVQCIIQYTQNIQCNCLLGQ